MPRISNRFLDCAVYLYIARSNAKNGAHFGGAGFLIGVSAESEEPLKPASPHFQRNSADDKAWARNHHLYVASNRHVARLCSFVRLTRRDGRSAVIKIKQWFHHETSDLAVGIVEWGVPWEREYKFSVIPHTNFLSQEEIEKLEVGPGDDTFCVGRFVGHDGKARNLPVVRFGNIAMLPLEPIETSGEGLQNVFLIESRTIQGYSGSPVFLNIPPWELRDSGQHTFRNTLSKNLRINYEEISYYTRFLGVVTAFMPDANGNNTGMMAAVPGWELLELLNSKPLKEQRSVERERWQREGERPGAILV